MGIKLKKSFLRNTLYINVLQSIRWFLKGKSALAIPQHLKELQMPFEGEYRVAQKMN